MRAHRFTIYDAMENKGYFSSNPANAGARNPTDGNSIYKGPQTYPKMLYHPKGEERVIVPPEIIQTPMGPQQVGEQRELIHMSVNNYAEDKAAQAEGWHDHPAKAIGARVEAQIEANPEMSEEQKKRLRASVPPVDSADQVQKLEAELAELKAQMAPAAPVLNPLAAARNPSSAV